MWSEKKPKIARGCDTVANGAFPRQNAQKLTAPGHLFFEVLMSKNCTPLWRKAHSEVKMLKN